MDSEFLFNTQPCAGVVQTCLLNASTLKADSITNIISLDAGEVRTLLEGCPLLSALAITLAHEGQNSCNSWEAAWSAQDSSHLKCLHLDLPRFGEYSGRDQSLAMLPNSLIALRVNYFLSWRIPAGFTSKLVGRCQHLQEVSITHCGKGERSADGGLCWQIELAAIAGAIQTRKGNVPFSFQFK